ncbi:AbrB/MazE/SpoVT family DNA-binding domain-containing protein [Candidatus Poriferisodalis sp.]|uniref:AbrB/MazE/SpoVT family DNA-binding domain-containing protein n=1 Tax=Candidatus Poriferisodalis sp. TaxID=3101277 RepID=UPI003B0194F8
MGNRGRIVVPSEVRARAGLAEGTPMVLVESSDGLVLLTRSQLKERVRRNLAGLDLVEGLLSERRREAAQEDAA